MPKGSGKPASSVLAGFRRKFILTNMLFAAVVLVAVVAMVFAANWQQRVADVYDALEQRVEMVRTPRGGFGPEGTPPWDRMFGGMGLEPSDAPLDAEPRESSGDQFVATAAYLIAQDGTVTQLEDPLGLSVDDLYDALVAANDAAAQAADGSAKGHIDALNLYFCTQAADSGGTYVALASGNYVDATLAPLLRTFLIVSLLALVAFFAISLFLARWAVRPVERAWQQQQQFIADASHELKTPLTVIIANDSILASKPEATVQSQMQWIESTDTEAKLMQGLVNDMLYLASSEGARRDEVHGDVQFSDLVEGVALQFESLAFERGVMMDDEVAPDVHVTGDATRLQRLVGTLVDNASKYAEDGGQVDVRLAAQGGHALLSVHNTGRPIDPQDLPHLFDRFYRADKARTSGKGGFGLGLAIAKSIVDDHGGTIEATSTEEAGTTFTVKLPLAKQ